MSQPKSKLTRRTLFAGAGTAGAAAAVATLVPALEAAPSQPELSQVAPEKGGGYSLTAHVRRYYQTARV